MRRDNQKILFVETYKYGTIFTDIFAYGDMIELFEIKCLNTMKAAS